MARIMTLKAKKAGLLPVDWDSLRNIVAGGPKGIWNVEIPKGSRRRLARLGVATTRDPDRSQWVLTDKGIDIWCG